MTSSRSAWREARIAAMKGPFTDWLRRGLASSVEAGLGAWLDETDPRLGAGVFRYSGDGGMSIFERGIVVPGPGLALAFADIVDDIPVPLLEFARATEKPQSKLELRLVLAGGGDAALMLTAMQYSTLFEILKERRRRARLGRQD